MKITAKKVEDIDTHGMMGATLDLPNQIRYGLDWNVNVDGDIDNIIICGMGGSAIGGDIVKTLCSGTCPVPIEVWRGYELPEYVSDKTLMMAVSYSGNTGETLSMLKDGVGRGAGVIGVTGGGKMGDYMDAHGIPWKDIPEAPAPRAAMGYLTAPLFKAMESAGLSRFVSDLRTTADELDTVIPRYSPGIEDGNIPVEIAIHLTGRFPIIYAPSQYAPAARRWMTQLNENAEVLALYGEMPEMAHNEIVGWDRERICESHVVLLLGEEETNLGILVDYFKELLDKWNVGCSEVGPGPAVGPMALFHHILVGDLASLYLAVKLELDPHTITPILELKDRYS